jgi:dimethylargininase
MSYEFNQALVRQPGRSVVFGLSSHPGPRPSYESVAREHGDYVRALQECGLEVDVLPPLEDFPDSVFVEDPALVFDGAAIVLQPGAPSRRGEAERIEADLRRHFKRVLSLRDGFADGGDMLLTPRGMLIGLSNRTNRSGAMELAGLLAQLGIESQIVTTPAGTLHLKSDCALIDQDCILCTAALAESGMFAAFRTLIVPREEERAANSLRLNDTILVGQEFPRTIDLLGREGYKVMPLHVGSIGKLDAGLSCMSLRWKASIA